MCVYSYLRTFGSGNEIVGLLNTITEVIFLATYGHNSSVSSNAVVCGALALV